jgi:hypothetical protein
VRKRSRGLWFKANPGKKFVRPPSTNKLGMVSHTYLLSYVESIIRRIIVHASLGITARLYTKKS